MKITSPRWDASCSQGAAGSRLPPPCAAVPLSQPAPGKQRDLRCRNARAGARRKSDGNSKCSCMCTFLLGKKKYRPSSSKFLSTCSFGRLQLEPKGQTPLQDGCLNLHALLLFQLPLLLLFFHTCKWYPLQIKPFISCTGRWYHSMKGNCSLQKDKRTEGVVISKIMLGKEKRKQKTGHTWTWKPLRSRLEETQAHEQIPCLRLIHGCRKGLGAAERRGKFYLAQSRTTLLASLTHFFLTFAFLCFLKCATEPDMKLRWALEYLM